MTAPLRHSPRPDEPSRCVDEVTVAARRDELLANVKLDPEDVVAVRTAYTWVEPGFHQSKRHWVSIDLTSPDYLADDATDMVEDSYRLVLSLLTRRVREAVLLADAAGSPARPTWQW